MTIFIKKTLLWSAGVLSVIIAFIFIFGSLDPLSYAVAKQPPIIRFEGVPQTATVLSQQNITQEIAKQIALELTERNPEGPQLSENGRTIAALNPEELAQQVLEEAFAGLQIKDLRLSVSESDLIIAQSSGPQTEEAYFNTLRRILKTNFPETLNINKVDPIKTDFIAFDSAFNKSIVELRQTPTPRTLVSFHTEIIEHLGALRNVFSLIKNYEKDPFQAAIATEAGEQFGNELKKVFGEINAYMAAHNLAFTN